MENTDHYLAKVAKVQRQIVGAEVVSPQTDAMRLVDGHRWFTPRLTGSSSTTRTWTPAKSRASV